MFKKLIAILICAVFLVEQTGFAQVAPQMPVPQYLQGLVSADKFRPMHLRSVSFEQGNDSLKVAIERGDEKKAGTEESVRILLDYFKTGVALPNSTFWVNLRPDAPDQIIDPLLEKTDLGNVLLEADLQLKKDMAALTDPNTPQGRQYWKKLYQRAETLFAGEEADIPTYNRPWIVPGEIILGVAGDGTAYVYKATLKVLLESDALVESAAAGQKALAGPQVVLSDPRLKELNEFSAQLIKQLILPQLTRQINSSKKYAQLRQVYYSLILAQWFKEKFPGQPGFASSLPVSSQPWSKDTYFKSYQRSFQQGAYSRQEAVAGPSGLTVRRYFSGGFNMPDLFARQDGGRAAVSVTVVPITRTIFSDIQVNFSSKGEVAILAGAPVTAPAHSYADGGKDPQTDRLMALLGDPSLNDQDLVRQIGKRGLDEARLIQLSRVFAERVNLISDTSRVTAALSLASALAMIAGLTYAVPVFIVSALVYMLCLPAGSHYKELHARIEKLLTSTEYLAGKDGGSWQGMARWVLDNEDELTRQFRSDPQRVVRLVEDQIFGGNLDNEGLKLALSFLEGHIFSMQFTGEKQAAADEIDFTRGPAWFSGAVRSLLSVFKTSAKYRAYQLVLSTIRENTWGAGRDGGEAVLVADMRSRLEDIAKRELMIKKLEKSADPQVWDERQVQVHIKQVDYSVFMKDARELARASSQKIADAASEAAALAGTLFEREEEIEKLRHRETVGAVDKAYELAIKERDRLHEQLDLAMDRLEEQVASLRSEGKDGGTSAETAEELITFIIRHGSYSPIEIVGFMDAQGMTDKVDLDVLTRAANITPYMLKDGQDEGKDYRMSRKGFITYVLVMFTVYTVSGYFFPVPETSLIAAYGPYAVHFLNAGMALATGVVFWLMAKLLDKTIKAVGSKELAAYTKINAVLDLLKERYDSKQSRDGGKKQQPMRIVLFEWVTEFGTAERRLKAMIEDESLQRKILSQLAEQIDVTDPQKDFFLNITDEQSGQLYLSRTEEKIIASADAYVQAALINMAKDEAVKYAIRDRAKVLLQLIDKKAARDEVLTKEAVTLVDRINRVLGLGVRGPEDVAAILRAEGALDNLSASVIADAKKLTVSFYSAVHMGTKQKWAARARNALLLGSLASTAGAFITGRSSLYLLSPMLLVLTLLPWLRIERSARVLSSDQKTVLEVVRLLEQQARASKDGGKADLQMTLDDFKNIAPSPAYLKSIIAAEQPLYHLARINLKAAASEPVSAERLAYVASRARPRAKAYSRMLKVSSGDIVYLQDGRYGVVDYFNPDEQRLIFDVLGEAYSAKGVKILISDPLMIQNAHFLAKSALFSAAQAYCMAKVRLFIRHIERLEAAQSDPQRSAAAYRAIRFYAQKFNQFRSAARGRDGGKLPAGVSAGLFERLESDVLFRLDFHDTAVQRFLGWMDAESFAQELDLREGSQAVVDATKAVNEPLPYEQAKEMASSGDYAVYVYRVDSIVEGDKLYVLYPTDAEFKRLAAEETAVRMDGGRQQSYPSEAVVQRLDSLERELLRLEQELAIIPDADHSPLARTIEIARLTTAVYEVYGDFLTAFGQVEKLAASADAPAGKEAGVLKGMAAYLVIELLNLSKLRMELETQKQEKPVTARRMIERQLEPVRTALAMYRTALFDCMGQARNAAQGRDFAAGTTMAESFPSIAEMLEADLQEIEETIARMEGEKILLAPWKQGVYDKMIERQQRLLAEKRKLLGKDGGRALTAASIIAARRKLLAAAQERNRVYQALNSRQPMESFAVSLTGSDDLSHLVPGDMVFFAGSAPYYYRGHRQNTLELETYPERESLPVVVNEDDFRTVYVIPLGVADARRDASLHDGGRVELDDVLGWLETCADQELFINRVELGMPGHYTLEQVTRVKHSIIEKLGDMRVRGVRWVEPGLARERFSEQEAPVVIALFSPRDGGEDAVEKIFDLYALLARKDNFEERSAAVFELGKIDHVLATRALIKSLKNDDFWGIRKDAAIVLREVTKERDEAMEALRDVMLHDEDWGVRQTAADSLGMMSAHAYTDSLSYSMVRDDDWGVRKAALRSLVQLQGGETADLLMRSMLYDPDWGVRKAAARALGHINSQEALPLLESVAKNETEWGVQEAAEESIRKLRGRREASEDKDGGSYSEQRDALIKRIAIQVSHVDEPAVIQSAQDFILLETGAKTAFNRAYGSGKTLRSSEALAKISRLRNASLLSLVAYCPQERFMPLAQVEAGIREGRLQLVEYQEIPFAGEPADGELIADVFFTPLGWKEHFSKDGGLGGIDLRALPLNAVAMTALAPAAAVSTVPLADLDREWAQILKQMQSGPMPYAALKAYVRQCRGRPETEAHLQEAAACVGRILEMEEEAAVATAPELKEVLCCLS